MGTKNLRAFLGRLTIIISSEWCSRMPDRNFKSQMLSTLSLCVTFCTVQEVEAASPKSSYYYVLAEHDTYFAVIYPQMKVW